MKLPFRFLVLLMLCSMSTLRAQSGLQSIIAAGTNDANVLMGAYAAPAFEGLIYSMNGGWATTARTHKKFGFDITIGLNGALVPGEKESFFFSDYSFENTVIASPDMTPTAAGNLDPSEVTVILNDGGGTVSFTMPDGVKDDLPLNLMPSPGVQAGIGLFFNTDVMVRFVPQVGYDDVEGQLIGVGIKHDLMQYFGPLDKLPLNIAILAAYSDLRVDYDIQEGDVFNGENQRAEFGLGTYTVQGLASLDFPFITVYGGVGYSGGTSKLQMLGSYDVDYEIGGVVTHTETFVDPIALKYNAGGARANVGARLNVGFFKIFADYTLQEYNNFTAGVSFSFR